MGPKGSRAFSRQATSAVPENAILGPPATQTSDGSGLAGWTLDRGRCFGYAHLMRRKAAFSGMVFAAAALIATLGAWSSPGAGSAAETAGAAVVKQLQGHWRSVGYGLLFEFDGNTLRILQTTAIELRARCRGEARAPIRRSQPRRVRRRSEALAAALRRQFGQAGHRPWAFAVETKPAGAQRRFRHRDRTHRRSAEDMREARSPRATTQLRRLLAHVRRELPLFRPARRRLEGRARPRARSARCRHRAPAPVLAAALGDQTPRGRAYVPRGPRARGSFLLRQAPEPTAHLPEGLPARPRDHRRLSDHAAALVRAQARSPLAACRIRSATCRSGAFSATRSAPGIDAAASRAGPGTRRRAQQAARGSRDRPAAKWRWLRRPRHRHRLALDRQALSRLLEAGAGPVEIRADSPSRSASSSSPATIRALPGRSRC